MLYQINEICTNLCCVPKITKSVPNLNEICTRNNEFCINLWPVPKIMKSVPKNNEICTKFYWNLYLILLKSVSNFIEIFTKFYWNMYQNYWNLYQLNPPLGDALRPQTQPLGHTFFKVSPNLLTSDSLKENNDTIGCEKTPWDNICGHGTS